MDSEFLRKYNWSKNKKNRTLKNDRKSSKHGKGKGTSNKTKSGVGIQTPIIDVADSSDDSSDDRYSSSNQWSKYEESDDKTDNEELEGDDFSILKNAPTGSYFMLSSEKHWEEKPIEKSEASKYFTLNLKLIKNGLATIPFYKRMDYDSSIFTHKEIKRMNEIAEGSEKDYQNILKEYELEKLKSNNEKLAKSSNIPSKTSSRMNSANSKNVNQHEFDKSILQKKDNNDELDALLNMTRSDIENIKIMDKNNEDKIIDNEKESNKKIIDSSETVENTETDKKEDLQEWLDSILDE